MGRSQRKRRAARESSEDYRRNVRTTRSVLLSDESDYQISQTEETITLEPIFPDPNPLIELADQEKMTEFWQAVASQEIKLPATESKRLRAVLDNPVFGAFYDRQIALAERELDHTLANDDYWKRDFHWMTLYDFENRQEEFRQTIAERFLKALRDPDAPFYGIDQIFFEEPLLDSMDFAHSQGTKRRFLEEKGTEQEMIDYCFNIFVPGIERLPDPNANLVRELRRLMIRNLAEIATDFEHLPNPNDMHNKLRGLLGKASGFPDDDVPEVYAPWAYHGIRENVAKKIDQLWTDQGTLVEADLVGLGHEEVCNSFAKQLATVMTRDYRQETENDEPEEKIRHGLDQVKSNKTLLRRLKPIFASEGTLKQYEGMISSRKATSISQAELVQLVRDAAERYVRQFNPGNPNAAYLSTVIAYHFSSLQQQTI